jgi:glycine cleavage system regulatory protein
MGKMEYFRSKVTTDQQIIVKMFTRMIKQELMELLEIELMQEAKEEKKELLFLLQIFLLDLKHQTNYFNFN